MNDDGREDVADVLRELRSEITELRAATGALQAQNGALQARLDALSPKPTGPITPHASERGDGPTTERSGTFDRRRLLSRAGTAAVGAVIGGAAASIAAASPAAAATGSFDSAEFQTPALNATNTAGGTAIAASSTGGGSGPVISVNTSTGTAIIARSIESIGVDAKGDLFGVRGSARGWGVMGASEVGTGVLAYSDNGIGMIAAGGLANLLLTAPIGPRPAPPPTASVLHSAGELVFDQNADLWLCTADGSPGTWVRLGGAGSAGAFTVLPNPVRVYDTRPGAAPTEVGPKQPLAATTPRSIDLTRNASGVPVDATAAVVTATVTGTTGGSPSGPAFLALYRDGTSWPGTSTLNWTGPGATIATTTVVGLGPGAKIAAYAAARTDLVIDVVGYYR